MYVYDPEDEYSQEKIWLGDMHECPPIDKALPSGIKYKEGGLVSTINANDMNDEIDRQLANRNYPSNPKNAARAGYYAALKLHGIAPSPPPKL